MLSFHPRQWSDLNVILRSIIRLLVNSYNDTTSTWSKTKVKWQVVCERRTGKDVEKMFVAYFNVLPWTFNWSDWFKTCKTLGQPVFWSRFERGTSSIQARSTTIWANLLLGKQLRSWKHNDTQPPLLSVTTNPSTMSIHTFMCNY